jgi:formylglycine-generating enzyme required for sulfatase activity
VENVSWDGCHEFLRKLNQLPALTPGPSPSGRGDGVRVRLPTEAEWEWACRAGTRTRFCSGDADDALADYAWFGANSGSTTHPVGEKKPNAWGLHDLHGNVWEWCGDWYDSSYGLQSTAYSLHTDPAGPATGSIRVLRGGSWYYDPRDCRSASRVRDGPADRDNYFGLRVVAPAGP